MAEGRVLLELAALGTREMRNVRRVMCQLRPPSVRQKANGEFCSEFDQIIQSKPPAGIGLDHVGDRLKFVWGA